MTQLIIPTLKSPSEEKLFPSNECFFPKILTEINGEALLRKVIRNIIFNTEISSIILIAEKDVLLKYSLEKVCDFNGFPDVKTVSVEGKTSGALCTLLLSIDLMNKDEDIIVANNDIIHSHNIQNSIDHFKNKNANAGVISFKSNHPKWSYVSIENEQVMMAAEKEVISQNAIAGLYWFKNGENMIKRAKECMLNMFHKDENYFLSGLINSYVLAEDKVLISEINKNQISHLNSLDKVRDYIRNSNTIEKNKVSLVIPAAGKGSRFKKANWKDPKPLIDINGKPMISHVIDDNKIDVDSDIYLAIQKENSSQFKHISQKYNDIKLVEINGITQGTACTVERVLEKFSSDCQFVVANSDQLCAKSTSKMVKFAQQHNLDGCITCFIEPSLDTKWSYVKVNQFNLVEQVAEKKAISDIATVGIYYFKSSLDYLCAYSLMLEEDERVNGEFYTCPVYNYLLNLINKDEMMGLGTPNDLNYYLDLKGYPKSKSSPKK